MLAFPSASPTRVAPTTRPWRASENHPSSLDCKLNSTNWLFSNLPKSSAHASGTWCHSQPQVLSGIFILTSLNDTYLVHAREHLRSCLHLTNPCAKWKVLSPTKPKGEIYETKSLSHYITLTLDITDYKSDPMLSLVQSAWAVEYTNCFSGEG